ncbi:hypothetical protein BJ944DRAFT_243698 [Cunninghamella echinulata]|nr:hypothetical protein BJ944DRAFT_243698 [Cunninghamella echinulata]
MTTFSTYQSTTTAIPTNTLPTVNTFTFGLPTPLINDRKPVSAPTSLKRSSLQVPPNSENLKQNSILSSPEARLLEKWNEDLQQYDITLEKLSSLENNVKEEIKHVDQWFRYLNETERTATLYVLLQHSSPVQARFFITVLKQLSQDPINDIYASPPPSSSSTTSTTNFAEKEMVTQYPLFNENKKETSFYPSTTYDPFNTSFMDDALFKRPLSEQLFTNNNNNISSNWLPPPSSSSISTGLLQRNEKLNHDTSPPIEHVVTRPKSADISQWSFGRSSLSSNNAFSNHSPTKNISNTHSTMHHLSSSTSSPHISTTTTNTTPAVTAAASRMTWQGISSSSSSSSPKRNSFYESNLYHHSTPSLTNKSSPILSSSSSPSTFDDSFFLTKLNQLSLYNNNNNSNNNNNKRFSLDNHPHHHHNIMNNHHHLHKPMIPPNDTQRYRRRSYHIPNDHNIMTNHSAPPLPPHSIYQQRNNMKTINNNKYVNNNNSLENNNINNNQSTMNILKERKNSEEIDMKILEDVPVWLRSLRLHKYNSIFETMTWQEMIILTDEELLSKGVMALGARRKLLKVFDQVKLHCNKNDINY